MLKIMKIKQFKAVVKGVLFILLIFIVSVEGYELITLKKIYEKMKL